MDVSRQATEVETLFLHGSGGDFRVVAQHKGERLLRGIIEIKQTDAGPRPARLRVKQGADEIPRPPDEFVDLARRSRRIRISEQTPSTDRRKLRELFAGYQLERRVETVRTCRLCATNERYSPLTQTTAIKTTDEYICPECAKQELEREADFRGLHSGARTRLEELLLEVGDLERITNLLSGELDPDLTKFDEVSATVEEVDPVPTTDLDLHPALQSIIEAKFDELLPVQSLAVQNGALEGRDQLVVSATATGKTLVGELAGLDRTLRGQGKLLFLVPLVALANQKHEQFEATYGDLVDVTIRVGTNRIRDSGGRFDPDADVVVGTYEGIDHALRIGRDLGDVATVVIDEVHTLGEDDRGHRLDGLISRLHHYCEERRQSPPPGDPSGQPGHNLNERSPTQWIYLSATVGNASALGDALGARLVEFEERPVPIERHVTFATGPEKVAIENRLVTRAFDATSSKGYRGQTIVFTNSRRRCHEISRAIDYASAPYHAGLDYQQRQEVERQFADQDLAAVITTAALAAGVDFPASQVIFDSMAMGIEWLSVQEFHQMLGRAGRPDYHDRGRVYLLLEPEGTYHASQDETEDEVAFRLLKGEMEPVVTHYDESAAVAETLANVTVAGKYAKQLNDRMVGEIPTRHALAKLIEYGFIDGLEPTSRGRVVTRHFLSPDEAFHVLDGVNHGKDPYRIVADLGLRTDE